MNFHYYFNNKHITKCRSELVCTHSYALEALDEDDLVIIPPEVDSYNDEENFDNDFLNVEPFPQEVAETLEIMKKYHTEEIFGSNDYKLSSEEQTRLKNYEQKF